MPLEALLILPAITNGYLYIGSNDHNVYQLNATNISQAIRNYTTSGAISSSLLWPMAMSISEARIIIYIS